MRMKPNHFEKVYGFKPSEDPRYGPRLFNFTTRHTVFSGVAYETTWNNTMVVHAAMQYAIQMAGITKSEIMT